MIVICIRSLSLEIHALQIPYLQMIKLLVTDIFNISKQHIARTQQRY